MAQRQPISEDEGVEMMKEMEISKGVLTIEGNSIKLEIENESSGSKTLIEFVSIREEPEITIKGDVAIATVSEVYIDHGGEEYEVDLNGPMNMVMSSEPFKEADV